MLMSFFSKRNCEIRIEASGRLEYREGNHEFVFPIYDEDGDVVIADYPSRRRIHLFFGWYSHPREFSERDRQRIVPRLLDHFARLGRRTRLHERGEAKDQLVAFHGELFNARGKATELLDEAGFAWLSHYSSIDLLHSEYGLEVCGIHEESNVSLVAKVMQVGFPQWHYFRVCNKDYGREPGWKFSIHMFPQHCGGGRYVDAD